MSVQRFDSYGYMPSPEGKNMRYDDHARIVAEAGAAVFAFHPEWTVTGMCDSDCLACRRLTELITEREKGYEEGKADAEQAHAAALAEERQRVLSMRFTEFMAAIKKSCPCICHEYTRDINPHDGKCVCNGGDGMETLGVAAPRTLTADENYMRGLTDARAAVDAVGRWRSFPDDTLLSRAAVLAAIDALIHDGEATP